MLEFSFVNAKEKESHKECNKKSLTSDFYINQVQKCRVTCNVGAVVIHHFDNKEVVPICQILSVRDEVDCAIKSKRRLRRSLESALHHFTIVSVRRDCRGRWKELNTVFSTSDSYCVQQWINLIRSLVTGYKRPHSILFIVNPRSGSGTSLPVFTSCLTPILKKTRCSYKTLVTERPGHARDMVMNEDLSGLDGIIGVGGDGTFLEILNGLLVRRNKGDEGVPNRLAIGIIPTGNTNSVAMDTSGFTDPMTSLLQIILGVRVSLDVAAVRYNDTLMQYGCCFSHGILADFLNPGYHKSFLQNLVNINSYPGEISYLPAGQCKDVQCVRGCEECDKEVKSQPGAARAKIIDTDKEKKWELCKGPFLGLLVAVLPHRTHRLKRGLSPHSHLSDGTMHLSVVRPCSRKEVLRTLHQWGQGEVHLPHLECRRVKAVRYTSPSPQSKRRKGVNGWNCDGSIHPSDDIEIRIHRKLVTVYGHGLESGFHSWDALSTASSTESLHSGCPAPLQTSHKLVSRNASLRRSLRRLHVSSGERS